MKVFALIRHWEVKNSRGNATLERISKHPQELLEWIKGHTYKKLTYRMVRNFDSDFNPDQSYIYAEGTLDNIKLYFDTYGEEIMGHVFIHSFESDGDQYECYEIQYRNLH